MYTTDYVRRYNDALDESRRRIAAGEDIGTVLKELFAPLIAEDLRGDSLEPSPLDAILRPNRGRNTQSVSFSSKLVQNPISAENTPESSKAGQE